MKRIQIVILLILITFSVSFSSKVIIDQRGEEVVLKDDIQRIVTLPMPAPALLFALDRSGDKIVGMHPSSMTAVKESILSKMAPAMLQADTGFVKSGFETNVEEVLKLNPDVILQWCDKGEKIIEPLDRTGIPVIGLKYGSQEDLEIWLTMFGELLDEQEQAAKFIEFHRGAIEELEAITENIPDEQKPKILYLPYGSQLYTTGQGTYNDFYFDLTGAINVASDIEGWKIVTMEQIMLWNPDIIYVGNFSNEMPEDFINNSFESQDWSVINAIKEKAIYKVPLGVYRWDPPSQESPLMWKWLLKKQHLELADYDMKAVTSGFYEEFYDYALSEEQLSKIFYEVE
jgi:iron complex transport system substrate-binding protein